MAGDLAAKLGATYPCRKLRRGSRRYGRPRRRWALRRASRNRASRGTDACAV